MSKSTARKRPAPSEVVAARLARCRERMAAKRIDAYLITNRVDQLYLTGFAGEDGAALILPDRVYLLTDGRFAEDARIQAPWARPILRTRGLAEAFGKLAKRVKVRSVGVQGDHLSVAAFKAMGKAAKPVRLRSAPPIVNELRLRKDETEVAAIRRAARVAEASFRAAVRALRPGHTERQLAARLRYEMQRRGASDASFPIIVAEGANASRPHATPGDRVIRRGSAVLVDWGAVVDGYRSDLTRMIFVRRIPPPFRRLFRWVHEAQARALARIGPGVRMCDVDRAARRYLAGAGMAQAFAHGTGHGLGLDVHEPPRLSKRSKDRLEPGMVVTVEPGLYTPGVAGVRIEDDVVVTDDGSELLTSLDKDLDTAVV